jgi:hypothetical protein
MATKTKADLIPELGIVSLRRRREVEGRVLPAGARGTVVYAYGSGAAYEVEFAEPFQCVVTLVREDVEPA